MFKAVFKTTHQRARDVVSQHLTEIADECDKMGKGITPVSCLGSECGPTDAGVTTIWSNARGGTNPISLCDIKETDDSCGGQDLGDVLLHEMSHSWGGTDDKCYGMVEIEKVTAASSLNNADSYTRYSKAAHLKCSHEAMLAPSTGGSNPPASFPGQDGQDGQDGISPGGRFYPPGTAVKPSPGAPSGTGTPPDVGDPPQGSPTPWVDPGIIPVQDGEDGDNGNNRPVNPGQNGVDPNGFNPDGFDPSILDLSGFDPSILDLSGFF
ncbi:hypothetical protein ARSEF1564_010212 [Beauveria bassiana]